MAVLPNCPQCNSEYTYEDRDLFVCPECAHEWSTVSKDDTEQENQTTIFKDAHGNVLQDGDTVTVIRDLKVKGSSNVIKLGTKVKEIRLIEGSSDGHDIDCRVDGFGQMKLKSEVVKKL